MFETHDLVIIGAGASGLAAAICAAADGVEVLVLDRGLPGGQAGSHARVEWVPGHPIGLSGSELTERSVAQATRFGAVFRANTEVTTLRANGCCYDIVLRDGGTITARAVIIAVGADLPVLMPALQRFAGSGVYTAAPAALPEALRLQDVIITGAPSAAATTALRLSQSCRTVTVLDGTRENASGPDPVLMRELRAAENIAFKPHHEIVDAFGVERIETVALRDRRTGRTTMWTATALFVVGSEQPRTLWLPQSVVLDDAGFVVTGLQHSTWPVGRSPWQHETSLPAVFAAGSVRRVPESFNAAIEDGIGAAHDAISYLNAFAARCRTSRQPRAARSRQ